MATVTAPPVVNAPLDSCPAARFDRPRPARPRFVLICHAEDRLNREGLARWLATVGDLVGIIALTEPAQRKTKRIRREVQRVGWLRFVDVLAFRLYSKLFQSRADSAWEAATLAHLAATTPELPATLPVLSTSSPNSPEAEAFLRDVQPTIVLARCKSLLQERIFQIPRDGTFVLHPGICPQYRNAHGGFWATANGDAANVGATLLKIDRGVDTGPVFAYLRVPTRVLTESHTVLQNRAVFECLPLIAAKFAALHQGRAFPIGTFGMTSKEWGQPWLTAHLGLLIRAGWSHLWQSRSRSFSRAPQT
jgi:hypothetical protein